MTNVIKQESKKGFKKVFVEGVSMYAAIHTPQKAFDPLDAPLYKLDLIVDNNNAALLEAEGLKPAKVVVDEDTKKLKEYPGHEGKKVFTFKRKSLRKDGEVKSGPEVVDSNLNTIPKNILIGNGSKVKVSISPYTMDIKGKKVTGAELLGVQVLELVKFENLGSGFEKTEGFVLENNNKSEFSSSNEENPFID